MLNVITVKNLDSEKISATLIGEKIDGMTMILSKPDMYDRKGWINSIHDEIINTKFKVFPSIEKDISLIEDHYHAQWTKNRKEFNISEYIMDVLVQIKEDIDDKLALGTQISDIMGEPDTIEFVDIQQDIKRPIMIETYLEKKNVSKLVFRFHHKDVDIYRETVGYAVYDPKTGHIECFYEPDKFFESLAPVKYGYAGEICVYDCIYNDTITTQSCIAIKNSIITMINGFDKSNWDKKVTDIFNV